MFEPGDTRDEIRVEELEGQWIGEFRGFSKNSFRALKRLSVKPNRQNYQKLETSLTLSVKRPMEALMRTLATSYDREFSKWVETRRRVVSHFHRQYWGRNEYDAFCQGAFYRKGLTPKTSPQLFVKILPSHLLMGFSSGKVETLAHKLSVEEVVTLGPKLVQKVEAAFEEVFPAFLTSIGVVSNAPQKTLENLFCQLHLSSQSKEAEWIRSVYQAAMKEGPSGWPFRQIIFQGVPGTGKTKTALLLAELIAGESENIETLQFHPSYSYEDFVGGLRPGGLGEPFRFEPGVLKKLCDRALARPEKNFVLLIDEINRGNVSSIFGELLYALEYRNRSVTLPFQKSGKSIQLQIPENLFVIGTMNSADRSIALMDYAFRRRFQFISILPKAEALVELLGETDPGLRKRVQKLFQILNQKITELNPDLGMGHSYFRAWPGERFSEKTLERIWELSILPMIREYFHSESRVAKFRLEILLREAGESG